MTKLNPRCTTCRIKNCSILKNCSSGILDEVSDKKKFGALKKGERLLIEGEDAKEVYFVQSGVAKVELNGKNGRPLILRLAGEGAVFGHRVYATGDKQPVTVVAVENMHVCCISAEYFHQLALKDGKLQSEITHSFLHELRMLEMRALQLVHKSVKERIAGIVLHIADIYQYHPGGSSIHVNLDRQDIADLAGTTKEQVSKFLAVFQEENLIRFRAKHFKFFDFNGLRAVAAIE